MIFLGSCASLQSADFTVLVHAVHDWGLHQFWASHTCFSLSSKCHLVWYTQRQLLALLTSGLACSLLMVLPCLGERKLCKLGSCASHTCFPCLASSSECDIHRCSCLHCSPVAMHAVCCWFCLVWVSAHCARLVLQQLCASHT